MSETSSLDYNSSDKSESNSSNGSYASSNDFHLDLTGDIFNNYNIISLIGKGSYAKVWLGYNISDGRYYALKIQNPDNMEEGKDEINILKKVSSEDKYVNRLVEYFVETRFVDEEPTNFLCSVYELCCGNLDGLSRKGKYKS